jgi:hypothetical protein
MARREVDYEAKNKDHVENSSFRINLVRGIKRKHVRARARQKAHCGAANVFAPKANVYSVENLFRHQ